MDEAEYGELLRRAFEYQLALVSNSRISPDDFASTQREAKDIFQDIEGTLRPWLGRSKEDRKANQEKEFKKQWEDLAGFNPEDKEALDEWSRAIREHTNKSRQGRIAAEQAEANRLSSFQHKVTSVRMKRLKQQGRK